MKDKLKNTLRIFIGLALMAFTFFLIFSHGSTVVQSKLFGTYLPSEATIEELAIDERANICTGNRLTMSGGCSVYDIVSLQAGYSIHNEEYSKSYILEKFVSSDYKTPSGDTLPEQFLNEYDGAVGDTITIYYDADNPAESVLHPEDEVITWLNYLILFPGMVVSLGFFIVGAEGLSNRKRIRSTPE